jgi:hypothetical protein
MIPKRYAVIQKISGELWHAEVFARDEAEAKKLAKAIGGRYDGEILEEQAVCEDCLQPLECQYCEELNELTAHIPEINN